MCGDQELFRQDSQTFASVASRTDVPDYDTAVFRPDPGVSPDMDGLGLVIRPDSGFSTVVGGLEPGNYLASLVCPGSGDGAPAAGPSLAVGGLRSVNTLAPVPLPAVSDLGPTNCGPLVDSSPVGGVGPVTNPGLEPLANVKPETLLGGSCYVDCVAHWLCCSSCSDLDER